MTEYEKRMTRTERQAHERAMRERDGDMELVPFLGNKTKKAMDQMTGWKGEDYDG